MINDTEPLAMGEALGDDGFFHESRFFMPHDYPPPTGNEDDMAANSVSSLPAVLAEAEEEEYTASLPTRVAMWHTWGIVSLFCFLFILDVFMVLIFNLWSQSLRSSTTSGRRPRRRSPFNFYLVFLLVPDLIMSGCCAMTCLANASREQWGASSLACYFQSWYVVFGFCGSAWMNALIARQVFQMLQFPATTRYQPPTLCKIARDSLAVLLFAAFVSSWGLWGQDWFPLKAGVNPSGISCYPSVQTWMDEHEEVGDHQVLWGNLFFYGFYIWILLGAPLLFVLATIYKIVKSKMLPSQREDKKRVLALFFFRLGAIFLVMWLPALFMVFIFGPTGINPWIEWAGGAWAHLQGLVSSMFILTKMDVFQAMRGRLLRLCCCCCQPPRPRLAALRSEGGTEHHHKSAQGDRPVHFGRVSFLGNAVESTASSELRNDSNPRASRASGAMSPSVLGGMIDQAFMVMAGDVSIFSSWAAPVDGEAPISRVDIGAEEEDHGDFSDLEDDGERTANATEEDDEASIWSFGTLTANVAGSDGGADSCLCNA